MLIRSDPHSTSPAKARRGRYAKLGAAVIASLFSGSLSIPGALAEDRAHQHGIGHLDIAVEGSKVEMELIVPGSDAVGFEHAPSTAADRRAVDRAVHKFEDGKALFAFPAAARCRFEGVEVRSGMIGNDKDHGHHGHHDHEKKNEHREAASAAKESHSEFSVHYHLHCDRPAALTHVDVKFFEVFTSARELASRWISARGQGGQKLTRAASKLVIRN